MLTSLAMGCDSLTPAPESSAAKAEDEPEKGTPAKDEPTKGRAADAKGKPAVADATPAKGKPAPDAAEGDEPRNPEAEPQTKPVAADLPPGDAREERRRRFAKSGERDTDLDPNYLVWHQLPAKDPNEPPRYRTTWLVGGESAGEATGMFLAETDELLLSQGEHVYGLQIQSTTVRSESCGWTPGETEIPQFEDFEDHRSRLMVKDRFEAPFPVHGSPTAPAAGVESFARTMEVTGNIGPYLFVKEYLYTMECESANGWTEAMAKIIDLRTRSEVALTRPLDDRSFAAIQAPLIAALEKKDPEGDFSRPGGPSDVVVAALRPAFEVGHMKLQQQLAVETCHACQDGEWEDSTISVYLPFSTPKITAKDLKIPPVVDIHYGHFDDRPHGYTELTTFEAKQTARQVFGLER